MSGQHGEWTRLLAVKVFASRLFVAMGKWISRAAGGVDLQQITMSLVCLVFLLVVLLPTLVTLSLLYGRAYLAPYDPNLSTKILIYVLGGPSDDFSRLTAFITPIFALLAGLKSRNGEQSLFFALFVSLSLFGVVGSLLSKYFLLSPDGFEMFKQPKWVGDKDWPTWSEHAKIFFDASYQTFLSFVSILLGLRVAGN